MGNFRVYRSSAGSGKTYTLVKEYLKLALADPHRLNSAYRQILAVTFTNKAAAEMKERVLKALREISSGDQTSLANDLVAEMKISIGDLQARCEELHTHLLHHYADFSVCTIDSFVYRIVRRFSLDLDLPANFRVETDEETPLWWAIDNLFTGSEQKKAVRELLREYVLEKVEDQKNWNVQQEVFDQARAILIAKKDLAEAGLLGEHDIEKLGEVKKALRKEVEKFESDLAAIGRKFFTLINGRGVQVSDFYYTDKGVPGYFKKLLAKDYEDLKGKYVLQAFNEDKWYTGKKSNPAIDEIKGEITYLFSTADTYIEQSGPQYYLHQLVSRHINSLCMLSELRALVERYKKERNIVFVSEFNQSVARFIRNEPVPYIYERLGDRYKHYLIDEFQDTSVMQWRNLLPLLHNSLSEGKLCMIVGDGKQSIYRWRGADVEQFANLPKINNKKGDVWLAEQERALESEFDGRELRVNRRSREEIIKFNNTLFEFLAEKRLKQPLSKVYEGGSQMPFNKHGGYITLQVIDGEKEERELQVLGEVGSRIGAAIEKGHDYGDIVVLVRKNEYGSKVANYLLASNIPVISSDSLLLKNCPETGFIISLISWLINPADGVSAAGVLAYLKNKGAHKMDHSMLRSISKNPHELGHAFNTLGINVMHEALVALPLYELCTEIIRLFELDQRNPLFLNFFLDAVSDFSQREGNAPYAFLNWWKEKGGDTSVKIPADTNAVRVLTIHASKGLEFPVVIFPFADWSVDKPEDIFINTSDKVDGLPAALVKTGGKIKNTDYRSEGEEEEQRRDLDNLNMLYVACTRAVDELHVVARKTQKGKSVTNWLMEFMKEVHHTDEFRLEVGEPCLPENKARPVLRQLGAARYQKISDTVNIKLSDAESTEKSRRLYGIAVHQVLASINTSDDIELAIKRGVLSGLIREDQASVLKENLKALVNQDVLKLYFSDKVKVKTEAELFSDKGEVLRPDRVVITEDHVAVIDFKTGSVETDHRQQIEEYKQALSKLYNTKVKGFIVFLPTKILSI